uniref:Uncharacterized protein n=1 Tax=Anopheles braziliensis TaxID=58242 RepID=A0A2M3ZLU4_9DIPT
MLTKLMHFAHVLHIVLPTHNFIIVTVVERILVGVVGCGVVYCMFLRSPRSVPNSGGSLCFIPLLSFNQQITTGGGR